MPYYETQTDIDNALIAAKQINKQFLNNKGKIHHFKKASPIDIGISYFGTMSKPLSLIETIVPNQYTIMIEHKTRSHEYGKYKTIWLSLSKYDTLIRSPENTISLFSVSWLNCTGFVNTKLIRPIKFTIDKRNAGNRYDDTPEIIVEFDIKDFTLVSAIG